MDEQKKELREQDAKQTQSETDQHASVQSRCYKCGKAFALREAFQEGTLECPHCHVKYVVGNPAVMPAISMKDRI